MNKQKVTYPAKKDQFPNLDGHQERLPPWLCPRIGVLVSVTFLENKTPGTDKLGTVYLQSAENGGLRNGGNMKE